MSIEFALTERNRIANDFLAGANFTIKAYSDTISNTGTGGTELTTGGYSAIAVVNNTTNFPLATTGSRSNAVVFETSEFAADASISSYGIFKTSDSTFLGRVVKSSPVLISSGQKLRFPVGSIVFSPNNPTS